MFLSWLKLANAITSKQTRKINETANAKRLSNLVKRGGHFLLALSEVLVSTAGKWLPLQVPSSSCLFRHI